MKLFKSLVLPVAIYACETWKMTEAQAHTINTFHQQCLRRILKVSWRDHITNKEILERSESERLSDTIEKRRMKMLGHIIRMPDRRHPKTSLEWRPPRGRRRRGRPVNTWRRTILKDLERRNFTWEDALNLAPDRIGWRTLVVAQCPSRDRRT